MKEVYRTETLEAKTKNGKTKYWYGVILQNLDDFFTQTVYWQEGGEEQSSDPKFVKPTNVGKLNERSGLEQAMFNITSLISKQQDKGYFGVGVHKIDKILPMLANSWKDKKHLVTYPVMVQPKLDGVRMMMKDGAAWSRKGKEFPSSVLSNILCNTEGVILDGELILDGDFTFQDTMKAIKKYNENSPKLVYHVFDIVTDGPFSERLGTLLDLGVESDNIRLVPTYIVRNEYELLASHAEFVYEGHEGTIIRNMEGKYNVGHRSSDLLKMKDFDDSEFEIVEVIDGEGRDKNAAIFVCQTLDKRATFNVRPRGTIEWRREVFANSMDYYGKQLTVRYQGFSEDGIPRFPVGWAIRDVNIQG